MEQQILETSPERDMERASGSSKSGATAYLSSLLRAEIVRLADGYDTVREECLPNSEPLFAEAELAAMKARASGIVTKPERRPNGRERVAVVIHGALSQAEDLHSLLRAQGKKHPERLALFLTGYNPYLANFAALFSGGRTRPSNFLTRAVLEDIAHVNGYEFVRIRNVAYFPWRPLNIVNSILSGIPLIRRMALASVVVLRRVETISPKDLKLSVVMPVRNEKGNVQTAVEALVPRPEVTELVFVEGNSSDGTWEEICRVKENDTTGKIKIFKQPGRGKWDAVIKGMENLTGNAAVILDGDLTVAPDDLSRFSEALIQGKGDVINGDRLVYPMETGAMRPLNRLGNLFFAKWVGAVMDVPIGDSLCGTKLLWSDDVERVLHWQREFGAKDPFGDFSLLFAAGCMGYRIVDVPVHYKARVYGATNINRFRDGLLLLWFTCCGLWTVRAGTRDLDAVIRPSGAKVAPTGS